MTGHATQRWQRSYARFSWTPQARRWIYPWDVFRRCSTLQFLMKSGRLTCRMHSASSPKFFAAIHSRRVHAIVSAGSLGVFYWWSAVFKSNMAGVQMCPVIWVKWGEAYKQHTKEFARLMCGTRKLEMYNLMLPRWMWHAVWTTENMYRVFRCIEYQVLWTVDLRAVPASKSKGCLFSSAYIFCDYYGKDSVTATRVCFGIHSRVLKNPCRLSYPWVECWSCCGVHVSVSGQSRCGSEPKLLLRKLAELLWFVLAELAPDAAA